MKRWMKALLSGAVIVALTVSMLGYLTQLVERKESYYRFAPFYEQEEPFDVLFLGTSHVSRCVMPMALWQDYGIVSYNMASAGNYLPTTYWVLQDYIKVSHPKLVVIDCYYLSCESKGNDTIEKTHNTLDTIPLSRNKINAIRDMFTGTGHVMEFFWDFVLYHDRWDEIVQNDHVPAKNVTKNSDYLVNVGTPLQFPKIDNSIVQEEDTAGVVYLRKMLEECREKGVQVLLTYLPFPAGEIEQKEANRAALIAKEYGVDYINFLQETVADYSTDVFDVAIDRDGIVNGHLNFSGASKVTDYLGQYIMEHYDISDRRDDANYAGWYDDYKTYTQYKINMLSSQRELKNYLMLLYDKHLSPCVYLAGDGPWRQDGIYSALLENMGIDPQALPEGPTLAVVDNISGKTAYLTGGGGAGYRLRNGGACPNGG